MPKPLLVLLLVLCFLFQRSFARTYTEAEGRAAWNELKKKPINEETFRATCDLMQDIGRTNLSISYEILAEYVPMVKATGNRQWAHILLMGWAKAKESTGYFQDAEKLYYDVQKNTNPGERYYREMAAAMALLYGEWGKIDSLDKWVGIGEKLCNESNDKETLSFLYGFKAMTRDADTAQMRYYFEKAIALAQDLPDKNALFTATYNYAYVYCQNDLQKQTKEFEFLLALSADSTLNHYPRRLYERTAFTFRNAGPSVYYNLMQINLLLTDYDNAWKFAELFYDATIKPNPLSINAPYFNAEMALVKACQNDFGKAQEFFNTSKKGFNTVEDSIPYLSYFMAEGLLAEHRSDFKEAASDFKKAMERGNTQSQHLIPPEIYYARMLIKLGQLDDAEKILDKFKSLVTTRKYSAIGLNYYQCYSDLFKKKGDNVSFSNALDTYYAIKDSLTNINRYRAVMEIETKMRIKDKENQIKQLDQDNRTRQAELRRTRILYGLLTGIAVLVIFSLVIYLRYRTLKNRQEETEQKNKLEQIEKQHRIEVMQGAIDAEENERRKIADQLHDETGGMLALASLNISSVLERDEWNEKAVAKLSKAHEVVSVVSSSIRDISHRLTPLVIEKYGFKKAIEDLDHSVNISGKLKMNTTIIGFDDAEQCPIKLLNDIYRIVQELVHNILKHAKAKEARLELVEHETDITIMIEDDGVGIGDYQSAKGKGLQSIESKIAYLKGELEISSKADRGTMIIIEIPIVKNA
ncbi:MAG: histidine kinase [Chitinophagaceae bacterium]